jgi:hypothetical protein
MIIKKEYDFSNAEQGRFYRLLHELDIPVRLDKDVKKVILKTARKEHRGPNEIVNELLRKDLELAQTM